MKILIPLLVFLAACASPDLAPVTAEMAELRHELAEVRKIAQPRLDAVEAMDDLAREVKQLRQKVANPPPAPAPAPAPFVPLTPLANGGLAGGVGGTQAGISDLYWVLTRVQVGGEERTVLALYRAISQGIHLEGVRMLNADLQVIQLNSERPSVTEIMKALEKAKK